MMFKNIEDALEVAIRVERQGIDFYNRLAKQLKSSEARDVFSFLAAGEEKHAGTFRAMLEKVAEYKPRYDYPGEYGLFLNAIASDLIKKAENAIKKLKIENDVQAIDAGIALEKETILFYSELLEDAKLKEKETLQAIIAEEKSHWHLLESLKGKIKF